LDVVMKPPVSTGPAVGSAVFALPSVPRTRSAEHRLLLVDAGNAPLTMLGAPAPVNGPSRVNWRRALVAVTSLAALGSMAYWTFGRPIFNMSGPQAAGSPQPAPPSRGAGNWRQLDQVLRKAHG